MVGGQGVITLDGGTIEVRPGDSFDVLRGAAHRIQNTGSVALVFVEVQHGDYFGEDDIVRLDDVGPRDMPTVLHQTIAVRSGWLLAAWQDDAFVACLPFLHPTDIP